jgi:RimJ/RimL family protein N-acetyltransferase
VSGHQGAHHRLTDRLDLRAITPGDVDLLHPIISEDRNRRPIPGERQDSLAASRTWIERFSGRWAGHGLGYWTVRLRATGAVIGVGGAGRLPAFWNLYYLIDQNHRGYGYATELARAAQREAAAAPDLPLVGWIHEENAASQAVARHLGLTDYGVLEPRHWNGEPMHCWADRPPVFG